MTTSESSYIIISFESSCKHLATSTLEAVPVCKGLASLQST